MALEQYEKEKAISLSRNEATLCIVRWHLENEQNIDKNEHLDSTYVHAYHQLLLHVRSTPILTEEDVDYIVYESVVGLREWAYHRQDRTGIKMGAYAHQVLGSERVDRLKINAQKSRLWKARDAYLRAKAQNINKAKRGALDYHETKST